MDFFESVVRWILDNKRNFSLQIAQGSKKAPLPVIGGSQNGYPGVKQAADINLLCSELVYTSDPNGGITDYYNHPEATQYRQNNKVWSDPCDCDDFAVYAVALFRAGGVKPENAWIWNLIIAPVNQFSQMWANHVICGFKLMSGAQVWTGIIDTNTAANKQVIWFKCSPEEAKPAIIKHFNDIYKVNYYKVLEVDYPF